MLARAGVLACTTAFAAFSGGACGNPSDADDSGLHDGSIGAGGETSDAATVGDSGTDALTGCIPKSCAQLEASCGKIVDNCGEIQDCGACPSGLSCGAAGPNLCGQGECEAKSCVQVGASCGFVSDGCAAVLD